MAVSDASLASQVVAPGELPLFFDDLGCLANYLAKSTDIPRGAALYVADHRTGDWVAASAATFTRVETLTAPMGSHLVAHASGESRAADPAATEGTAVAFAAALPGAWAGGRP